MHAICKSLCCLALWSVWVTHSHAQTPAPAPVMEGHLSFVNATGEAGILLIFINDEAVSRRGYASGRSAGPMGFLAASYNVKLRHDTLGELEVPVTVTAGSHQVLVVTPKPEPKDKTKPEKVKMECQVLELGKGGPAEGTSLALVQLTNVPKLDINVSGTPVMLDHGKPQFLPVTSAMGKFPRLMFRQTRVTSINMDEPRDMVVVFFTDKEGVLKAVTFGNRTRQEVQG